MKLKFLFVVAFIAVANLSYSQQSAGNEGAGTIGGGLGMMQKSLTINSSNETTPVYVLNEARQEIYNTSVDELEYYLETLAVGKYIIVYTNSKGEISGETTFYAE